MNQVPRLTLLAARPRLGRSMRRALSVIAALALAGGACSTPSKHAPPLRPVVGLMTSSAFTLTGASTAGGLGVQLAPGGSVSAVVFKTASVTALVFGGGQTYQVSLDGHTITKVRLENCQCWKNITLARGLSSKVHALTLTNAGFPGLIVHTWSISNGGAYLQRGAASDSPLGPIAAGHSGSFYVQGVSSIVLYSSPADVVFDVTVNDRPDSYRVTLKRVQPTLGGLAATTIAWGLTAGIQHITLTVSSGTLAVRRVAVYASLSGSPRIVPDEQANRAPLLAVYGDSVADGLRTLGFLDDADGFGEQVAAKRSWRVAVDASPDATTCFGIAHVADLATAHPIAVIVSLGLSDIAPAPGSPRCGTTLEAFRHAMGSILNGLTANLARVPIYVEAILPSTKVKDDVRAKWNDILKAVCASHRATFVDPSKVLFPGYDYSDLPNNRGHARLAAFWNSYLPSSLGS